MSKYICNECNCKFKVPKKIREDYFYGVSADFVNSMNVGYIDTCPNCESNDIEEQIDIYDLMEEN